MEAAMNRFTSLLIVAALGALVIAPTAAQKNGSAQTMLEAAKQKETLEGDLASAIKQYQAVVDKYSKTDRGVAVQALVRMADCYRKLGDTQARNIYERIMREFTDQKDAVVLARTRLGEFATLGGSAGMVNVQKWTGPNLETLGTVSPDGRYVSFADWGRTGDLALHDLMTGADRRLTNNGTWTQSSDFALESALSHDGTQVAYSWYVADKGRYEVRVMKLDAITASRPKTILDNSDIEWIGPYDWSPDGKWLAVALSRTDRTSQLGLVNATDGSLKILKSVDWRGTTNMFFSPDAAFVAYDLSVSDASEQRDVFVLSIDGSQEIPAVVHPASDVVMGWSPDGHSLLFASDRAGSMAIWALPFANGRPQGAPVFLKDLGSRSVTSLGLTRAGSLLYGVRSGAVHIEVASVDFETGKVLVPPKQTLETYVDIKSPNWSRDGKYMVYTSERPGNRNTLAVQSVETGQVRPLGVRMAYAYRPRWTPDGSIIVDGADLKGRQGIYRIDAQTGEVFPIVVGDPGVYSWSSFLSPDGKLLFYRRDVPTDSFSLVIERNLASGSERELVRSKNLSGFSLSPDGRQIAFTESDPAAKTSTLFVMAVQAGPTHELFRAAEPTRATAAQWTPDGRHLVFSTKEGDSTKYWIIPSSGGTLTRLELEHSLAIHPDGRQVAFTSGSRKSEVWALEHFLPPAAAAKK
jgi:Tol biopolymer transport system component